MYRFIIEWIDRCISFMELTDASFNEWTEKRVDDWTGETFNEWTYEQVDELIDESLKTEKGTALDKRTE